ncbi:hypothetical protein, partial [Paenibacillus elgii]|uniref:hypothetical protein n=1 Tax=Paenibacillus elgii TaxID=189691 RepID=UPI00203D6470
AVILAPIRNSLFQQPGYSLQAHSGAFWAVILAPIREFIIPAARVFPSGAFWGILGRHSRSDSGIHYSSSRVFPSGAF